MNLKLKNIQFHEASSSIIFTIEARYGYMGMMYGDLVKLNYFLHDKSPWISGKMLNPGIGLVIERIIEALLPCLKPTFVGRGKAPNSAPTASTLP